MDPRYPLAAQAGAPRNRNLHSGAPGSYAAQHAGEISLLHPAEQYPPANAGQDADPQLTAALQNLLQCQADFFNQVVGETPTRDSKDFDTELQQALCNARGNNREEKREIRRWALDFQIAYVLDKIRDPRSRRDALHCQMTTLLSFDDDDGGDNMWVKMGFDKFSDAIQRQEVEIENMESARAHMERERIDAIAPRESQSGRQNRRGGAGERMAAGRGLPPGISGRSHSSQPFSHRRSRKKN